MEKKRPWMKWYPSDWRGEPKLRMCSLAARGLWADMISYMHEGQPYGHFTIEGHAPNTAEIAALVSRPLGEVEIALAELDERQVFSRTPDGVIYSRRMVRDEEKARRDHRHGKNGGNPKLIEDQNGQTVLPLGDRVNPPDKAHIPYARGQIDAAGGGARISELAWQVAIDLAEIAGQTRDPKNWMASWCGAPLRVQAMLDRGWPCDAIIAGARKKLATHDGSPIYSVKYFEPSIANLIAALTKPLPEAASRENRHAGHAASAGGAAGSFFAAKDEWRRSLAELERAVEGEADERDMGGEGGAQVIPLVAASGRRQP